MARIGNLEVRLGLDKSSFDEGIRNAADQLNHLDTASEKLGRGLNKFGGTMTKAGSAMTKYVSGPIAGAAAATIAFSSKMAGAANAIDKSSREAGLSAEAFQELGFALGQVSQISDEQARTALATFNGTLARLIHEGNFASAIGRA